jgi:SPP1 gp7 family putative phage head morphogenesis protein
MTTNRNRVRKIERTFVADVTAIVRGMHDVFMRRLSPRLASAVKVDATTAGVIEGALRTVLPQIGAKVGKAHDKMSNALDQTYKQTVGEILPVGFQSLGKGVQRAARDARAVSISLVETAARDYAAQVRAIFSDPAKPLGRRVENLRDDLIERGNVSESRAELIARDQTLKLNGAINKARQESVGVERYTWSTSGDERVRDEHAALDRETFSWGSPPSVGHPGEDIQCRCIALPIIDDLADL